METSMVGNVEEDSTKVKFSNDKHAKTILAALNVNRSNDFLCDGIVVIGQDRIKIQKAVLSAASHYFRLNFSFEVANSSPTSEVDLTSLQIRTDTFKIILDYIYTSEIELSEDNIQDVLQASDALLLGDLKAICCEYLEGCISPQNCLGIMEFAGRLNCAWIHLKASQYVDENFRHVSKTEEFMRLDEESLKKLLNRVTLNAADDSILDSILTWYKFDKAARETKVDHIVKNCFNTVRWKWSETVLRGSDLEQMMPRLLLECKTAGTRRGLTEVIFIAGGEGYVGNDESEEIEALDVVRFVNPTEFHYQQSGSTVCWKNLAPMTSRRSQHGLVECGGCVFAIGGRGSDGQVLDTGEKYDPLTNTWTPIACMEQGRMQFGLVAINENIYAVGGSQNFIDPLPSAEVYNIFTNTWRRLPDMNIRRLWFSCVALNKTIYVIGGGFQNKLYESVDCFDTQTESWFSASPLREKRAYGKAVALDDYIYVFGGVRRSECPSAMMHGGIRNIIYCGNEQYLLAADEWIKLCQRPGLEGCMYAKPENSRIDCVLKVGELIFVLGKFDLGNYGVNAVRGFDRRNNSWFCAVPHLPDSQISLSGCAVKIPNHIVCG